MNLDGTWNVRRTAGWLPPMLGVHKRIVGRSGETRFGRLFGVPFEIDGNALRYRKPFSGFVDVVEQVGAVVRGRATFRGREFGRFEMRRVE